jgi:hypothetical protein
MKQMNAKEAGKQKMHRQQPACSSKGPQHDALLK